MKNDSKINLRPIVACCIAGLIALVISQYIAYQRFEIADEKEHEALLKEQNDVHDRLYDILYNDKTAANTLAILCKEYGIPTNFDTVARQIIANSRFVDAVQLTNKGIITNIYPLKGHESAIGINTLEDSLRRKEAEKAVSSGTVLFAGPRKLIEGGEGILCKVPIIVNGELKGFSVVITKTETIKKVLGLDRRKTQTYAYMLTKLDGALSQTDTFLTTARPLRESELISSIIPEGNWRLSVGYAVVSSRTNIYLISIFGLLLSVALAILVFSGTSTSVNQEKLVEKRTHDLGERVKELSAIFAVNEILKDDCRSVKEVFTEIAAVLPPAWQYPELCAARILFDGQVFSTEGYRNGADIQTAQFELQDGRKGTIEVVYLKKMPLAAEGPFLKEERDLINTIAQTITIYFNKAYQQRALQQTEARFRGAFEHAAIGMAVVSTQGQWLMVNHELCHMLGYEERELLKLTFHELTHPEDLEKDRHFLSQTLNGETDFYRVEKRYFHKGGSIVWVNLNVSLIKDNDSNPLYFVSQIENITARIESQLKFQNLVEKSLVGVYILQDGKFAYVNPRIASESGYTEEELTSMPVDQFVFKDDLPLVQKNIQARLKGEIESVRYETRVNAKNGKLLWMEMFGSATFYRGAPAIIGTIVNNTEKKAVYDQLVKSEANLKSIFDNTQVAYLLVDQHFTIVAFNQYFLKTYFDLTGFTLTTGANYFELVLPDKRDNAKKVLENVSISGKVIEYETSFSQKEPVKYFSVIVSPVLDKDKIIGMCVAAHDITNRKSMEDERRNMIADLVQRNNDLREFAQIVSHNLRAPLANILGISDILTHAGKDDSNGALIEGIGISAKRLDSVVMEMNNILTVKNALTEVAEIVDLQELARELNGRFANLIAICNATIEYDFNDLSELLTNRTFITDIFYNLISNSLNYRSKNRTPVIKISAERKKNKVIISVQDNGRGIDLEQYGNKIFGLNRRFHEDIEGKGLGLFITKAQVEMLNGNISVESQPEVGTTFTITLPFDK